MGSPVRNDKKKKKETTSPSPSTTATMTSTALDGSPGQLLLFMLVARWELELRAEGSAEASDEEQPEGGSGPNVSKQRNFKGKPNWKVLRRRLRAAPADAEREPSPESIARAWAGLQKYLHYRVSSVEKNLTFERLVNLLEECGDWRSDFSTKGLNDHEIALLSEAKKHAEAKVISDAVTALRNFCRDELHGYTTAPGRPRRLVGLPVGMPTVGGKTIKVWTGLADPAGRKKWWNDDWVKLRGDCRDYLARPEGLAETIFAAFVMEMNEAFPAPAANDRAALLNDACVRAWGCLARKERHPGDGLATWSKRQADTLLSQEGADGSQFVELLLRFAVRWDPLGEIQHRMIALRQLLRAAASPELDGLLAQMNPLHDALAAIFHAHGASSWDEAVRAQIRAEFDEKYGGCETLVESGFRRLVVAKPRPLPTDGLLDSCLVLAAVPAGGTSMHGPHGVRALLQVRKGAQAGMQRRAEALAKQLLQLFRFLERELHGYRGDDELPPYRRIRSVMLAGRRVEVTQKLMDMARHPAGLVIVRAGNRPDAAWVPLPRSTLLDGIGGRLQRLIDDTAELWPGWSTTPRDRGATDEGVDA
ncbi:hypothetical protein [Nannocystis sp. SCPEA4]|uniref:hypothetical protein n=1 Tax=Nannocystis sp. SCPEA4 TaxID=2996787 RepID=UPI00226D9D6E|nr:hypothetical protein [Nannocystis sp. SCPEA4]MCY1054590.1 hypothetical protein [Nannocystis sp. SCPEA4]